MVSEVINCHMLELFIYQGKAVMCKLLMSGNSRTRPLNVDMTISWCYEEHMEEMFGNVMAKRELNRAARRVLLGR